MRIKIAIATVVILLLSGVGWAWWASRPDPQLAKAEALSKKIFADTKGMPDISKPEVREQFKQLQTEVEAMPEETRQEFMESRRNEFQHRMQEQFDRYFAMTPEEKEKELDRVIDQMDSMRKSFEKERAERAKNKDGGSGSDGAANGAAGGGSPGRGGPGFGPPGGPPRDPASRNEFRKKMLDTTSPQFRAQASEFMKDMFTRMKERGKEPPPFPGGGGPPF